MDQELCGLKVLTLLPPTMKNEHGDFSLILGTAKQSHSNSVHKYTRVLWQFGTCIDKMLESLFKEVISYRNCSQKIPKGS